MSNAIPVLETQPREKLGTRYAKRERDAGRVPAVIYGHKKDPVHVNVDARELSDILHADAHVIDVKIQGKSEHVLIKDRQWDTYSRFITHIDLERVDMSEEVEIDVELKLLGDPVATRQTGTVLDHPTTKVGIRCRADLIPSHLEHNIADLEANVPVTVADLTLPAGITITTSADQLICQISGVKISASVEAAIEGETADTSAEPEVIGAKEGESE